MFKKIIYKLENIIVWSQGKITNKQFIFLSSVLVGISAAFAVIVLKTFLLKKMVLIIQKIQLTMIIFYYFIHLMIICLYEKNLHFIHAFFGNLFKLANKRTKWW